MLNLNFRDTKPIYIQIKDGIKKLIITGAICADEKVPSVRELAESLAINPNTIQKAYKELETEGYLYSISGRGTFASSDVIAEPGRKQELMRDFEEVTEELLYLTVTSQELKNCIDEIAKRRMEE
ncbi:MAG: GntR family transcriptional regulator [Lachnospiraceae bacterium]|nr:GntR family transcriptional regulator [Lachnospiraceae bacterium]MDD7379486.1 GntR family transcriptional regulator [Lachnospiraceae bacterium]MDY4617289.1 GntR family transcriptional regulator [Lachnospiraceae bacterium]